MFSKANLNRLANLKVTCTNRCALSKLDVLAANHDQPLKDAKEAITAENSKLKELKEQAARVAHVCSGTCEEQCLQGQVSLQAKECVKYHQSACHPGFTIAFDNTDLEINAKNMTMSKQNRDAHWVNHKMFVNRVSGNSLAHEGPLCDLLQVSNCSFLPSVSDLRRQRFNYMVLI